VHQDFEILRLVLVSFHSFTPEIHSIHRI
jgi:hypothetical protein